MPIRVMSTGKAIPLHWPKRAPPPSGIARSCSWCRRRPSRACRGSNANTRPPTSGATSCHARIAATMQWLQFERLRWEKGSPETAAYICQSCEAPITEAAKTEMLAKGEWRATAEGSNPRTRGYHLSASIRRWAGPAGPTLPEAGTRPSTMMQRSRRRRTCCSARPGWSRAKHPTGSGSTTGVNSGRPAPCPRTDCSSPPAPTSRRTASRSMSGPGGGGSKAGSSIMS